MFRITWKISSTKYNLPFSKTSSLLVMLLIAFNSVISTVSGSSQELLDAILRNWMSSLSVTESSKSRSGVRRSLDEINQGHSNQTFPIDWSTGNSKADSKTLTVLKFALDYKGVESLRAAVNVVLTSQFLREEAWAKGTIFSWLLWSLKVDAFLKMFLQYSIVMTVRFG